MQAFTAHETVFYVDLTTGELRHGSPSISPPNARLLLRGPIAQIVHVAGATLAQIACSADCSRSLSGEMGKGGTASPTLFEVIQLDQGRLALRSQGLYLCAEKGGRVTLSRAKCQAWESFTLREARPPQTAKIAAFTTVYNDPIFLPIWLQYYGHAFGEQNLFVLDHGSDDGSTANLGSANRVRVPRDQFDEDQRRVFVSRFQASLLCYYDVVIFSDPDEILVADPDKFSQLGDFVARRCDQFVTAIGVEVQQVQDIEGDIDFNRPLLSQRRYARFGADYCKTLISRVPLVWRAGFHSCNYEPLIDRDLFLFHLKTIDRNLSLELLKRTRSYPWSERALKAGQAFQARMADDEFIKKFFPFSSRTIESASKAEFDFAADLRRFVVDRPNVSQFFKGRLAVIPEKFHNTIGGLLRQSADTDRSVLDGNGRNGIVVPPNHPFTGIQTRELLEKNSRSDAA
jgi:hypothetical protein